MKLQNKNSSNIYWVENKIQENKNESINYLENRSSINPKIYKENQKIEEKSEAEVLKLSERDWKLEIPKIGLKASIAEGTTEEILNMYIGHFEESQKTYGNIGLAAHNRGYNVNYFSRLKELENGDEMVYTYLGEIKKYKVVQKFIIEDTNWKVLENTVENKLTLITCVENEPNLRLCVQAIES